MHAEQQAQMPDWCVPNAEVIRECPVTDGTFWVLDRIKKVEHRRIILYSGCVVLGSTFRRTDYQGIVQDRLWPADDKAARVMLWSSTIKRRAAELSRIATAIANTPKPTSTMLTQNRTVSARLAEAEKQWRLALLELGVDKPSGALVHS